MKLGSLPQNFRFGGFFIVALKDLTLGPVRDPPTTYISISEAPLTARRLPPCQDGPRSEHIGLTTAETCGVLSGHLRMDASTRIRHRQATVSDSGTGL